MGTPFQDRPTHPRSLTDRLRWLLSFVFASVFLGLAIAAAWMEVISPWVSQAYLAMSLITLVAYGLDKEKAARGEWRTTESLLHLLELACGWPGALLAQQLFRHKTRKVSYQIFFWFIIALHIGLWGWLSTEHHDHWPRWLRAH